MILTTTPTIEGREIDQYLGLVFASERLYEACISEITVRATGMHADAVVGINISAGERDVEMLGTAVKLK